MRRLAFLALGAALLGACTETRITGEWPEVAPQALAARGDAPAITATLLGAGASGTFRESARNGAARRYDAPDGSALVLSDGVLIATFALGYDLVSADVSDLAARLASGQGGPAERIHRYLDGENRVVTRAFRCEVSFGAPRPVPGGAVRDVTEACRGADAGFTNTYQRDAGTGEIVGSTQWVGPVAGSVRIARGAGRAPAIVPVAGAN